MHTLRLILALALASLATLAVGAPADEPSPRYASPGVISPSWLANHERFKNIANAGTARFVLLGDSLTSRWGRAELLPIYNEAFSQYDPANFGVSGDRTENILWRIVNGEFPAGFAPKVVMLMAGVNNLGAANTDAEIISGVRAIIQAIHERTPNTTVLLLGLPPTNRITPEARTLNINATLATFHNGSSIVYFDLRPWLTTSAGKWNPALYADNVHLNAAGYQAWAGAIKEPLATIMGAQGSRIPEPTNLRLTL